MFLQMRKLELAQTLQLERKPKLAVLLKVQKLMHQQKQKLVQKLVLVLMGKMLELEEVLE
jgi:hypothetical protein